MHALWYVNALPQRSELEVLFQPMKTQKIKIQRHTGFTLVELAIVLLIIGILMSAGLSLATVKRAAAQRDATQTNQLAIKQALINFLGKNQRLPCPATATSAGLEVVVLPVSTTTPCNATNSNFGLVPYQTLGLDRSTALDGWENFITYVVSPVPPVATTALLPTTTAPNPQFTTFWLTKYSTTPTVSPCDKIPCTSTATPPNGTSLAAGSYAFWPSSSIGGITVVDSTVSGNPIADPIKGTGAVVALISYGANGYGATNIQGGTNTGLPAANKDEANNTNPYQQATSLWPVVVKRDATDSASGGPFDDVVMIISASDLTGPLIANGTFQINAMQALNQANDNVVGYILSNVHPSPCDTNPANANLPKLSPLPNSCNASLATCGCQSQAQYDLCQTSLAQCQSNCSGSDHYTDCTNKCSSSNTCTSQNSCLGSCSAANYATYTYYNLPLTCTPTSTPSCPFPPTVTAWGVSFTQGTTPVISAIAQTTSSTTIVNGNTVNVVAYILAAGDGTTKTVTVGELQGIISHASGF
jgi:prepilin-type N-terminal cleavage/methylation domain-containing protein